jgi:hypothetical protein
MADYYVNTGSYLKNCVNKSQPSLRCKGKCQLSKKMQSGEKSGQQNTGQKPETGHDAMLAWATLPVYEPFIENTTASNRYPIYPGDTITGFSTSIFRPPIA